MEDIREVLRRLELALLDPQVRRSRARLDELLSNEFSEIGSSGRVWTRSEMIDSLLVACEPIDVAIADFSARLVANDLALVTYSVSRANSRTLRSSLWRREQERWRLLFHQGTSSV
jgi:hypothetical protein